MSIISYAWPQNTPARRDARSRVFRASRLGVIPWAIQLSRKRSGDDPD